MKKKYKNFMDKRLNIVIFSKKKKNNAPTNATRVCNLEIDVDFPLILNSDLLILSD